MGKLYISPYKNFRQKVRGELLTRHPVTGDVIERKPTIAANFGELGDEQPVYNPLTQEVTMIADIRTGVFDTAVAQAREGWTDEEREMVERKLDEVADRIPSYVQRLEPHHVPAPAPWQTYATTAEAKVVPLAQELDLVPETLRFERENRNRAKVVSALEAAMTPGEEGRAEPLEEITVPKQGKPALKIKEPPKVTDSGIVVDTPGLELKNPSQVHL